MPKPAPLTGGDLAPAFNYSWDGDSFESSALKSYCLLYFYPKDDTPGCTKEACAFRDHWDQFQEAGLQIVGVSKDSETSHEKFRTKYELPFPLIADTDLQLAKAYGVYGEKKFMGKTYDGVHRISFLISPDGTIAKTYPQVKPAEHAAEILQDLTDRPQST